MIPGSVTAPLVAWIEASARTLAAAADETAAIMKRRQGASDLRSRLSLIDGTGLRELTERVDAQIGAILAADPSVDVWTLWRAFRVHLNAIGFQEVGTSPSSASDFALSASGPMSVVASANFFVSVMVFLNLTMRYAATLDASRDCGTQKRSRDAEVGTEFATPRSDQLTRRQLTGYVQGNFALRMLNESISATQRPTSAVAPISDQPGRMTWTSLNELRDVLDVNERSPWQCLKTTKPGSLVMELMENLNLVLVHDAPGSDSTTPPTPHSTSATTRSATAARAPLHSIRTEGSMWRLPGGPFLCKRRPSRPALAPLNGSAAGQRYSAVTQPSFAPSLEASEQLLVARTPSPPRGSARFGADGDIEDASPSAYRRVGTIITRRLGLGGGVAPSPERHIGL